MTRTPDLSEKRAHAEAVAYGKLCALREILDELANSRPAPFRRMPSGDWRSDYILGYDEAVQTVKAMRLGVES